MVKARTFDLKPEAGLEPVPLQRAIPPAAASLLFGTRRHYSRVHDSDFLLSRRGSRQVPIAPPDSVPRPSNGEQLPSRPVDGPVGKRAERAACATGTTVDARASRWLVFRAWDHRDVVSKPTTPRGVRGGTRRRRAPNKPDDRGDERRKTLGARALQMIAASSLRAHQSMLA
jgi:hypothetical protein